MIPAQTKMIQAQGRTSAAHAQQWLLLFNCQAAGLAHCLSLQCKALEVEFHDPVSAARNSEQIASRLDGYDRILVAPALRKTFSLAHRENVWCVPSIQFHAYQPDMCWFASEFVGRQGWTLGNYHSIIAYTAFKLGLDLEQALALYRDDIYSALGYYAQWERESDLFYLKFQRGGFDMAGSIAKWSRSGAFMYLPIHPKIDCLNDLARAILRRAGLPMTNSTLLPQDNLVAGPVFPIYPEIGQRLGIAGDYLFKPPGRYRLVNLPEFVAQCYRHYGRFSDVAPIDPCFADAMQTARIVIAKKVGIAASRHSACSAAGAEIV